MIKSHRLSIRFIFIFISYVFHICSLSKTCFYIKHYGDRFGKVFFIWNGLVAQRESARFAYERSRVQSSTGPTKWVEYFLLIWDILARLCTKFASLIFFRKLIDRLFKFLSQARQYAFPFMLIKTFFFICMRISGRFYILIEFKFMK